MARPYTGRRVSSLVPWGGSEKPETVCSLTRCCNQKRERGVGKEKEQEMEQEREEREKEREQAEEERERLKKEEGEEKSESWQRRRRKRPWRVGGDGLWGVPTYPGAWTANLQLPCGSGLVRKIVYSV